MTTRVFTAALGTEVNTFSPIAIGLRSFQENTFHPAGAHPDHPTFLSWPRHVARRQAAGAELVVLEGLTAMADQGGPVARAAHEALRDQILADLEASLPVDIVLLGLHGGMVADGCEDTEGDLLARIRQRVGPDVVIGATFDLHGHVTPAMVAAADVLVGLKTFPHTDMEARAEELLSLCLQARRGEIRPCGSLFDCRMLGVHFTSQSPMQDLLAHVAACEQDPRILSVTLVHSSPWADVADAGAKVLVVTDGDPELAAATAEAIGRRFRAIRGRTAPAFASLDEVAARLAQARPADGPLVIGDVADNPNGGAPGDSTFLMRLLLEAGRPAALACIWDPIAVKQCFEAGEGARLALRIGGKMGKTSGAPLDVEAEVRRLAPEFRQVGASFSGGLGDCALVAVGPVRVVLASSRLQAFSPRVFTDLGVAPEELDVVVVKSTGLFQAEFAGVAGEVMFADSPGCLTFDPTLLDYQRIARPMWPLDPELDRAWGS